MAQMITLPDTTSTAQMSQIIPNDAAQMAQIIVPDTKSTAQMQQIIFPDPTSQHRWHRSPCQIRSPGHRLHRSFLSFQTKACGTDGAPSVPQITLPDANTDGTDSTSLFLRRKLAAHMAQITLPDATTDVTDGKQIVFRKSSSRIDIDGADRMGRYKLHGIDGANHLSRCKQAPSTDGTDQLATYNLHSKDGTDHLTGHELAAQMAPITLRDTSSRHRLHTSFHQAQVRGTDGTHHLARRNLHTQMAHRWW